MSCKCKAGPGIAREVEENHVRYRVASIRKLFGRNRPLGHRADEPGLLQTGYQLLRTISIGARNSRCQHLLSVLVPEPNVPGLNLPLVQKHTLFRSACRLLRRFHRRQKRIRKRRPGRQVGLVERLHDPGRHQHQQLIFALLYRLAPE